MVQKEGQKRALSVREPSAITNERLACTEASQFGGKQATDHKASRPARPHHRGLSDAIIHPIGAVDDEVVEVDSVSSSGSLRCRRPPKQRDVRPSQFVDRTFVVSPIRSLTSVIRLFWPRRHHIKPNLGSMVRVRASPRQGNFTFLHLLAGVGGTLLLFTLGRRD